jgi:hypothetical protein
MCHDWVRTKVHGCKFCVACSSVSSVIRDCSTDETYEKEEVVAYLRFLKKYYPAKQETTCGFKKGPRLGFEPRQKAPQASRLPSYLTSATRQYCFA